MATLVVVLRTADSLRVRLWSFGLGLTQFGMVSSSPLSHVLVHTPFGGYLSSTGPNHKTGTLNWGRV